MDRRELVQRILINIKANEIPVTGDLYFAVIFRTDEELREMAQLMNIR